MIGIEKLVEAAEELLCERLGGVTSYPARGAYIRESGEIQREQVQVLESFCDEQVWEKEAIFLKQLAKLLARELDQESVACSLDGEMSFAVPDQGSIKQFGDFTSCHRDELKVLLLLSATETT